MDPEQYLQVEPPRRSLMTRNFVAVDPFRPSLSLGIRNLFGNFQTGATIDDIPIPVDVMSRPTHRNGSEVHRRRDYRSPSPMTRRSRTRGRSASRRYVRTQHAADRRHTRPISSASSSRSSSRSGRGIRDRRRSSLTGRSSAPLHDHRQVSEDRPGVPNVLSQLDLLTSAPRQRTRGQALLSVISEQVESSASRAPLSQRPAIDERKSSFDAMVEGSLPSSSSGFDIVVEPPSRPPSMSSSVEPYTHGVAFLEPDERNDESPPRVIEINDDLHLPPATNSEGHPVQPRHVETPPDNWIPTKDTSNSVRLPPPHELQRNNDEGDWRGRGRDRSDSPRLGSRSRSISYPRPYSRTVPRFDGRVIRSPSSSSKRAKRHRVPSRSHGRSRIRSKSRSRSAAMRRRSRSQSRHSGFHSHRQRRFARRSGSDSASLSQSPRRYRYPRATTASSPHAHRLPEIKPHIKSATNIVQEELLDPTHFNETAPLSTYIFVFFIDTLPRQVYLYLMLRLPSLYFSRVTRIFEDAEMSMPEIKKMALEAASQWKDPVRHLKKGIIFEPQAISHPHADLQNSWQSFIDSLMREWKTLNIVSVLLLSAILTILQIQAAASDPFTRYFALLSLVCALMSLLYGCMYIVRFGTMRKTYKAAEWATEAQKSRTGIFWNVWVLLAMPAAWLAWSMILYLACIMSFVWRTGTTEDANIVPLTPSEARVPRALITFVLALGVIYFFLIAATFRRYGDNMDRAWQQRIIGWTQEKLGHMHGSKSSFRLEKFSTPRFARSPEGQKSLRASTPKADHTTSSGSTNSKPLSRPSSVQMATFTSLPQHSSGVPEDLQALPLEDLSTSSITNVPLSHSSISQGGNILAGNSLQSPIATPQNDAPRHPSNSSVPVAPNFQRSASVDEIPPISARRDAILNMNIDTRSGARSRSSSLDNNPSFPYLKEDFTKIKAPPCQIELVKNHRSNHKGGGEATKECPIGLNASPALAHRNRNFLGEPCSAQGILCCHADNAQLTLFAINAIGYDTDDGKPRGEVLSDGLRPYLWAPSLTIPPGTLNTQNAP